MTDSQTNNGDQTNDSPQYGQYRQPEYGAMANQYPAGYNPYLYGAPERPSGEQSGTQQSGTSVQQPVAAQTSASAQSSQPTQPQPQYPSAWQTPYGQPGVQGRGTQRNMQPVPPHTPRIVNGIDLDDPNQNPLYGRWDPLSIVSLVCALVLPMPALPAIMGAISMRRTRMFHMKGFWLGFAAVFINVFYTIMVVWLAIHGLSMFDYYQQMLDLMNGGTSGGTGGTISA